MKNLSTKKIIMTGLFAAMIFVATRFTATPVPFILKSGYIHAGDAVLIVGAYILGGPLGAIASAIGSALADLAAGYTVYIPATFIIKGLMALVAATIFTRKLSALKCILGTIVAELIMIAGYFVFEFFMYGKAVAIPDILGSVVQGAFGVILGFVIIQAIKKVPYISSIRNENKK